MKALITGASSGIGRDIARYLSSLGYDIVVVARREDRLIELKNELKTNVEVIPMDVSLVGNCKKLFDQVPDVDVLINNAGFGTFGNFDETDLETEIGMINTNVTAVHTLTKLYLKKMKERNSGHILNVASIAGFMPGPLMATYYASKSYVLRLSQSIATELRKANSRVKMSVLCPGPVKTEFNDVANVSFATKYVTSEYAAKYAVDKMLKGKEVIIPSFKIKVVRQLTRLSPDKLISAISYKIQHRKK